MYRSLACHERLLAARTCQHSVAVRKKCSFFVDLP